MLGLRMKKEYLLDILTGNKFNDSRMYDTRVRGRIGLIDTDTYKLYGYVELYNTKKVTYEDYILWHARDSYEKAEALEVINKMDFTKLKRDTYLYEFRFKEVLEKPLLITPISEHDIWIEFDPEQSNIGYEQMSLFSL